jgi:hypothetical protein
LSEACTVSPSGVPWVCDRCWVTEISPVILFIEKNVCASFGGDDIKVYSTSPFLPSVVLKQKLDREMLGHYQIYLIAKDGGQPQRSSMLTINVTVSDINDNKPIFSRTQYDITVPEDISVTSKILNITAVDKDAGKNGEVEYTLISENFPQLWLYLYWTTNLYLFLEHYH